eukprot:GHVR01004860.1.p1 GENE.GHVR01004860.1~~GHVR01004860.1.p1  ORF type:complete len:169 (+),score=58.58 GHVR01004860.1:59-565(+)
MGRLKIKRRLSESQSDEEEVHVLPHPPPTVWKREISNKPLKKEDKLIDTIKQAKSKYFEVISESGNSSCTEPVCRSDRGMEEKEEKIEVKAEKKSQRKRRKVEDPVSPKPFRGPMDRFIKKNSAASHCNNNNNNNNNVISTAAGSGDSGAGVSLLPGVCNVCMCVCVC